MGAWFHETIIQKNRLALFLCFLAFTVTFLTTRIITRNIRAGRGPFKDNVSKAGVHIHHAVPGLILLVTGAFMSVATGAERPWTELSAIMIGVGTSLVLDEFALIVHLSDVYWAEQGRVSVEVVSLTVASLGLALVGFSPNLFTGEGNTGRFLTTVVWACLHVVAVIVCVLKGRYEFALLGAFLAIIAIVAMLFIARPESMWAKRFYGAARMVAAQERAARWDARFGRRFDAVSDFIAGKPSDELRAERAARRRVAEQPPQAPATGTG